MPEPIDYERARVQKLESEVYRLTQIVAAMEKSKRKPTDPIPRRSSNESTAPRGATGG